MAGLVGTRFGDASWASPEQTLSPRATDWQGSVVSTAEYCYGRTRGLIPRTCGGFLINCSECGHPVQPRTGKCDNCGSWSLDFAEPAGAAQFSYPRAQQNPQYASQITAAAKESFLSGDQWAYTAGIVAVVLGAVLVATMFPSKERELELLAAYQAQDEEHPAQG